MKKIYCLLFFIFISLGVNSQNIKEIISLSEVNRIEKYLSSDELKGRNSNGPGLNKAAEFIANEFGNARLNYLPGLNNYYQEFKVIKARSVETKGFINNETLNRENVIASTSKMQINVNNINSYEVIVVGKDDDLFKVIGGQLDNDGKLLFLINPMHEGRFKRLRNLAEQPQLPSSKELIFILTNETEVNNIVLQIRNELDEQVMKNVVGIIPGKSKSGELVVFSGHYDHLGIGKPNAAGDSIFNGANDDAAGITSIILLANYFSKLSIDNERTLVFIAFTAEEQGGYGSKYFSQLLAPSAISAMFNIEMVGTKSKWGLNSAYITGYDKSNFGEILQKNLKETKFKFYPDPYPEQKLFYRSDNATLAKLGVPAHTISTSKMDNEMYYHTVEDEIETLDLSNMVEIIRAIAVSSTTIIKGQDTPTRIVK